MIDSQNLLEKIEGIFNRNYDMSFSWGLSGIAWLMLFTKKQMGRKKEKTLI